MEFTFETRISQIHTPENVIVYNKGVIRERIQTKITIVNTEYSYIMYVFHQQFKKKTTRNNIFKLQTRDVKIFEILCMFCIQTKVYDSKYYKYLIVRTTVGEQGNASREIYYFYCCFRRITWAFHLDATFRIFIRTLQPQGSSCWLWIRKPRKRKLSKSKLTRPIMHNK